MGGVDRRAHWDRRYRAAGVAGVGWFEAVPELSLRLLDRAGAAPDWSLVDVGGGASVLARVLVDRGWSDVTVLDVSPFALAAAQQRTTDPGRVTWIEADLLSWQPARRWRVWHDRAVFHFLTDPADRDRYRGLVHTAVEPGGTVVIITFADNGPATCSGLPVQRYRPGELRAELGDGFTLVAMGDHQHLTPTGDVQPLTWVVAQVDPVS